MSDEFKLNYYFAKYKDKPLSNRNEFRNKFKKQHGKSSFLEELILMIERYQLKKYGTTLNNFVKEYSKEERQKLAYNEYSRKKGRKDETRKFR